MGFQVTIGNLDTGHAMRMQYVPNEVKETAAAKYQKQAVLGLPHEVLQYTGGENFAFQCKFECNGLVETALPVIGQRNFLMSLTVPVRGVASVKKGAPPDVLLDWPELYSLTCKLVKVETELKLFSPTGAPTMFHAQCSFEEARWERLVCEDVARFGTLRGR